MIRNIEQITKKQNAHFIFLSSAASLGYRPSRTLTLRGHLFRASLAHSEPGSSETGAVTTRGRPGRQPRTIGVSVPAGSVPAGRIGCQSRELAYNYYKEQQKSVVNKSFLVLLNCFCLPKVAKVSSRLGGGRRTSAPPSCNGGRTRTGSSGASGTAAGGPRSHTSSATGRRLRLRGRLGGRHAPRRSGHLRLSGADPGRPIRLSRRRNGTTVSVPAGSGQLSVKPEKSINLKGAGDRKVSLVNLASCF